MAEGTTNNTQPKKKETWVEKITNMVKKVFDATRIPLQSIPPLLLVCEIAKRPGLSCISLTNAIIQQLQKIGIPTEPNKDGSPNLTNLLVKSISCNVIDEFQNNARVEGVVTPGQIVSVGTGANAGGPVVVTSQNLISTSSILSIIR